MTMRRLEVIDAQGSRVPYDGPLGAVNFTDGLSEPVDITLRGVWRIIRQEDGGGGQGPTVRVLSEDPPTIDHQGPAPVPPAPPPPAVPCDRMAAAREAKAAKRRRGSA